MPRDVNIAGQVCSWWPNAMMPFSRLARRAIELALHDFQAAPAPGPTPVDAMASWQWPNERQAAAWLWTHMVSADWRQAPAHNSDGWNAFVESPQARYWSVGLALSPALMMPLEVWVAIEGPMASTPFIATRRPVEPG